MLWRFLDFLAWADVQNRIQKHFTNIHPETVKDVDKYLRAHGWMI